MTQPVKGKGEMMKGVRMFLSYFFFIVIIVYGVLIGVPAFCIDFTRQYNSSVSVGAMFKGAFVFYGVHMGMAVSSILGIIPGYGNKLHYLVAKNYIFPWASLHGVNSYWLFSLSGFLSGTLGSMCPSALIFQIAKARGGFKSEMIKLFWESELARLLIFTVIVFCSIYSAALFFNIEFLLKYFEARGALLGR